MKIGNFLFPDCRDPERDGIVIDETLREAWLSDQLGVDVIWLAEHHFDGICAYVDPISFAGALATSTRRSKRHGCACKSSRLARSGRHSRSCSGSTSSRRRRS